MEREWKPNVEISPPCPRCGSCNTKFCYYNNYSLTQPRYFCKGCRRYWTKGGSLRNVPVGGGCRRSRRGKSIRISTDGVSSRSTCADHHGGASAHNGNPLVEPSTSSSNGPNIDLALVYANFLNQEQPDRPENRIEIPELSCGIDPSFEFASVVDMHMDFSTHLLLQNEAVECPTLSGLYHNQTTNYGLPPLPGEEELGGSQEMGWSNNPQVMGSSHIIPVTQPPRIEPEAQDQDQLMGDRATFELSSFGTFFRP